jgi:hypothetical protein
VFLATGNECQKNTRLLTIGAELVQVLALTARSMHCDDSVRFLRYLLRGEGSARTPAFVHLSDPHGAGHRGPAYWGKADIRALHALVPLRGRAPAVSAVIICRPGARQQNREFRRPPTQSSGMSSSRFTLPPLLSSIISPLLFRRRCV